MSTYEFMRDLADVWGLLLLFGFFIGVVLWAFRPGASKIYEYQASTPLRNEDKPAPEKLAGAKEL